MDTRIIDGDIAVKSNGDYAYISGLEEAVQQVRLIALTARGSFLYDRALGVDYDALGEDETDPVGKLDMLIREATSGMIGVETEALSYDVQAHIMTVKVTYYGKTAVTEVNISGIL